MQPAGAILPALVLAGALGGPGVAPATERAMTKTLVLCLDGTWNSTYDQQKRTERGDTVLKPTNVLKMCRAVLPRRAASGATGDAASGAVQERDAASGASRDAGAVEDAAIQITYYDSGVGSQAEYPGFTNKLLAATDKMLGGAWGAGFEANVEDALGFLVNNYEPGAAVYIFGFSRGAAEAQAVTRFLAWCGAEQAPAYGALPQKRDAYYLPILFRAYVVSKGEKPFRDALAEIEAKRARENRGPLEPFQAVPVRMLGVWDTVMALGSRFQAKGRSTSIASRSFHVGAKPARCVEHARQALAIDEARYDFRPEIWQDHWEGQSLEQRWFAGVHSNVGGGYVDDGLANVAFRWILAEAQGLGLAVDPAYVAHFRSYPQDRLYRSEKWYYRLFDALRMRFGRGRRNLAAPASAALTLDKAVIHRLLADPLEVAKSSERRFPELQGKPYRPANALRFLACLPDLDGYLRSIGLPEVTETTLPPDVRQEIARLRLDC